MNFIADMHTHTIASTHAYCTIMENARAAAENGLAYLGMTDHCIKMQDSPNEWHFCNLVTIPRFLSGVRVIRGVEADIMDYEGTLDTTADIERSVEWINVSYHYPCCVPGTREENTMGYLGTLKNPKVCVLAHTDSPDYDYDEDRVTKACAQNNVLIELNCSRLGRKGSEDRLRNYILPACVKNNCRIIVDSDAHFCDKIGSFEKAAQLLRDINFPLEMVVNADISRFEEFLKSRNILTNSDLK